MELLERAAHLAELDGLLRQAMNGHGRLLFLGGEAGVGKSALISRFADQVRASTRVLAGACDPLSTPRPLGPLIDIGEQTGGDIATLLQESPARSRSELFKAVLADLAAHPSSLVIIEDAHWADEATLDLIRHLGRRLGPIPALVVVTYRDDEAGGDHPLRRVLGDLATTSAVRRLALRRLSVNAVITMAASSNIDPLELHQITGGNPFFVTEALSLGESGVPPTVRDAVLARASRLSPEGKRVLEACAVIGSPIEPWLLMRIEDAACSVDECLDSGILVDAGSNLAFRHELARRALLETVTPVSRMSLHTRVLAALIEAPSRNLARLAHHAEEAGDAQAVLEFAPVAAEQAAALGAHREAAAQYARALRFAESLQPRQHGELLEAHSFECYLTNQLPAALNSAEAALEIWRRAGDRLKEADAFLKISRISWVLGRTGDARARSRDALDTLEVLGDVPLRAVAYSNQAQLHSLAWETDEAIAWGEKAIALAERFQDTSTLIQALTNVGSARFTVDSERGRQELERCLTMAREYGIADHAARAFVLLARNHAEIYQLSQAVHYLDEGIRFCTDNDLDYMRLYLLAWKANTLMYQGNWSEAEALVHLVLPHTHDYLVTRIVALAALGRIQARRGNAAASTTYDEALDLASPSGDLLWLGPVRAGRAESSWLAGDFGNVVSEALSIYEEAVTRGRRCLAGELAFWRWRAGEVIEPPDDIFEPFALQISGRWKEAAARWRALGCPYETASALADSDDEADLRYALAELNRLGAIPAAAKVSQRLRELAASMVRRRVREPIAPFVPPQIRYVKSGDVNIAYQVVGDGPLDLVFVMGWVSNLEYFWKGPFARFLQRLASFSRLILFDKRGTGLSDRVTELPTIEQRMDDVRAVMEAAGSERAALFGVSEGAPMCAVFAATYPERTTALVIYGGFARRLWAPDYPWAPTLEERNRYVDSIEQDWGNDRDLDMRAPSAAGDEEFRQWWGAYLRMSASPGAARALARMNSEIDIRHLLPAIRVPSLIVHRSGDLRLPVEGGRYLADHIPGAKFVELPGFDHLPFAGDQDAILDEVELFLTGSQPVPPTDRVLATVVSIEIAAADRAASMGDRKWRAIQESHERATAEALVRFRGDRIKSTADGLLASFDGPGRAIRFAVTIADAARNLGLETRAGLHTGECEKTGESLSGIALHIASRIMFRAEPGQVVVSSTVKDLVAGSGIAFDELGEHVFTELAGEWRLFRVQRDSPQVSGTSPVVEDAETRASPAASNLLSRREREIALLIVRGLSNRQIGNELSISPATVERHVSNIFNKLGYHSRAQIAAWAVEHDLASEG